MKAWGRLLRLSLAPSAAADIAAGTVFAARDWPRGVDPFLLIGASLCVYHGGMALNDWADRDVDRRLRPDRPIPSGSVSSRSAGIVAVLLLVIGPAVAVAANVQSGITLTLVALLATIYDLFGRGPWLGPLLLSACRAGNLFAGLQLGRATGRVFIHPSAGIEGDVTIHLPPDVPEIALVAGLYGLYVFFVSRLGRLEDDESRDPLARRPAKFLVGAAVALGLPALLVLLTRGFSTARLASALLSILGASALARAALATEIWTRAEVMRCMGLALRRLLVFTAAVALLPDVPAGWIVAAAILCGYPLSFALRGIFPPS